MMALKGTSVFSWIESRSNPSGFVSNGVKSFNPPRNIVCFGGFSGNKAVKSVEDDNPAKPSSIENDASRGLTKDLNLISLPSELMFFIVWFDCFDI